MEQLVYTGPNRLERREAPAPVLAGDGEALVRPVAVATCDLDALILAGGSPFPPPFPVGHECVAEVVEVGDDAGAVAPGDRVVVPFQISCGTCPPCRRGRTGNCASVPPFSTYGFGPGVEEWGGFLSDLVRVPHAAHMLVPVPERLGAAAVASASDNLPDAWRTVGPALAEEPGASVLVVGGAGPGSIGLYAAALAVALGAGRVLYLDADPGRRARAEACGAETAEPGEEPPGQFPITVDASADPAGLTLAVRSTAPDGTCTSTGIYFGAPPTLPLLEMYVKVCTFRTGRAHVRPAIPAVLELASVRALEPERVTSGEVAWADAAEALVEPGWTKLVVVRE